MTEPTGFLTPASSLASDLSLLAYIFLIVPSMLVGFVFARRRMFVPHHKLTMTTITLVNWVIIALLMAVSYSRDVAPYLASDFGHPTLLLPTIHLVTGAVAQLLGSYLVCRMWFEKVLPQWMMVRNIKIYMRFTLAMWLITAALGITIYAAWYVRPNLATDAFPPAVTPEISATDEIDPSATDEAVQPVTTDAPATIPIATDEAEVEADAASAGDEAVQPIMTEEALPTATDTPVVEPVQTEDPTSVPTATITLTPTPCPTLEPIAPDQTPEITSDDPAATPEVVLTEEPGPTRTPTVAPCVTAAPVPRQTPTRSALSKPVETSEVVTTPEVAATPEVTGDDDRDDDDNDNRGMGMGN